jgi:LysM repeat protein
MFRKRRSSTAYRVILVALVIALGVSLMPSREARAAGGTTALVTCSSDDVKTAPDIYAQTIATYYQNQTVTVTGERTADGIWARVVLPDGRLGWMKVVCVAGTPEQPAPPSVPTGHTVRINTGALNVRTGPGWWYPIITRFFRGTILPLGQFRNADASWVQVIIPSGQTGWVNASYVISSVPISSLPVFGAPTPTTVFVGPGATIFSGPSWFHAVITTYPHGTTLTLGSFRTADNQWVQVVLPDGRTGWVATSYALTDFPIHTLPIFGGTTPPPTQPPAVRTHVVQAGENLYRIGLRYGVSWPKIAAANGIPFPYRIFVGQVLIIP